MRLTITMVIKHLLIGMILQVVPAPFVGILLQNYPLDIAPETAGFIEGLTSLYETHVFGESALHSSSQLGTLAANILPTTF